MMILGFKDNTVRVMRRSLLHWYCRHGRTLAWRGETDLYRVWISEIMLQQTQVQTVIPYYQRWLSVLPTVADLASADLQTVLKLWEGLGYYARARNLHDAAQQIMTEFGGRFPEDIDNVLKLKGIGRTTAGGILSAALNLPFPILDGNVKRVLARIVALDIPVAKATKSLWQLSEELLDGDRPRDFNQALMDLGATLCTLKQPDCLHCPWQQFCQAYLQDKPTHFPKKSLKKKIPTQQLQAAIIYNSQGKILIQQRPATGLLGGLWEFPNYEGDLPEELQNNLQGAAIATHSLKTVRHAYSHFRIELSPQIYRLAAPSIVTFNPNAKWVSPEQLQNYPFSKAHLKIIEQLPH